MSDITEQIARLCEVTEKHLDRIEQKLDAAQAPRPPSASVTARRGAPSGVCPQCGGGADAKCDPACTCLGLTWCHECFAVHVERKLERSLRSVRRGALAKLPLRVERDWTWEVHDAEGKVILKLPDRFHAEALCRIINEGGAGDAG